SPSLPRLWRFELQFSFCVLWLVQQCSLRRFALETAHSAVFPCPGPAPPPRPHQPCLSLPPRRSERKMVAPSRKPAVANSRKFLSRFQLLIVDCASSPSPGSQPPERFRRSGQRPAFRSARETAAHTLKVIRHTAADPPHRWCRTQATTCPIPTHP